VSVTCGVWLTCSIISCIHMVDGSSALSLLIMCYNHLAVSFSYPSKGEEVSMNLSRTGSKKNSATFNSNAAEVTPDQMR
jgi:hypothetical protein